MIKTSTLHTINATEEQLKKNLYSSYLDILNDLFNNEATVKCFENDVHRLSSAIQDIDKHGFTSLFKEGYTMMLLDTEDFNFVDQWFNEPGNSNLQVVVTKANGSVEIISQEDLCY